MPARPMIVAVFAMFMPMFGEGCRACAFVAMLMFVLVLALVRRLIVVIVVTRHRRPLSLRRPSGDAPGRRRPRDAFTIRIGGANADAGYIVRCNASDRSVFDADSFSL